LIDLVSPFSSNCSGLSSRPSVETWIRGPKTWMRGGHRLCIAVEQNSSQSRELTKSLQLQQKQSKTNSSQSSPINSRKHCNLKAPDNTSNISAGKMKMKNFGTFSVLAIGIHSVAAKDLLRGASLLLRENQVSRNKSRLFLVLHTTTARCSISYLLVMFVLISLLDHSSSHVRS